MMKYVEDLAVATVSAVVILVGGIAWAVFSGAVDKIHGYQDSN